MSPLRAAAASLVGAVALWSTPAWAGAEEEIDEIAAEIVSLRGQSSSVLGRSTPGGYLSADEAIQRFQDDLFLHLVGRHEEAATGFFALVTTGVLTDAGMQRDAEWYLAESLAGMGNLETAASRFKAIVTDPAHPFRIDAVRRLLELYARIGNREAFRALYDAEVATGKVGTNGQIAYTVAKSYHIQGDRANARANFQKVTSTDEYYGRSRYYLAVMDVEDGELAAAEQGFTEVAALPVAAPFDRDVHDLALLALGRLAYTRKDFPKAYESYAAIGSDSTFQDEKLYEAVWTSIRREDWQDALNNVDIFLLAFPDHQYAARLRLLQGHLNFERALWDDAVGSYEIVIRDYEPVRQQFARFAASGPEAEGRLKEFLLHGAQDPNLPEYAVALMQADAELGDTLRVFTALDIQRANIEASERLIGELRAFVKGSGASSSYDRMKLDAVYYRSRLIGLRLGLLAAEERWLGDTSLSARRAEIERHWKAVDANIAGGAAQLGGLERTLIDLHDAVEAAQGEVNAQEKRIADLEPALRIAPPETRPLLDGQLAEALADRNAADTRLTEANQKIAEFAIPDLVGTLPNDVTVLWKEVVDLRAQYAGLRSGSRTTSAIALQADAAHQQVDLTFDELGAALAAIERSATGELGAVRARFDEEVGNVARERRDYERTTDAAQRISLDVTRRGFGRLEDFFAESVLSAEQGIVDVYWAEKLETDDQLAAVREEKDATLAELDRRFRLIREKLGATGGAK